MSELAEAKASGSAEAANFSAQVSQLQAALSDALLREEQMRELAASDTAAMQAASDATAAQAALDAAHTHAAEVAQCHSMLAEASSLAAAREATIRSLEDSLRTLETRLAAQASEHEAVLQQKQALIESQVRRRLVNHDQTVTCLPPLFPGGGSGSGASRAAAALGGQGEQAGRRPRTGQ